MKKSWTIIKYPVLYVFFVITYMMGSIFVGGYLPNIVPQPGPVPELPALLLVTLVHYLVIIALLRALSLTGISRVLAASFSYYGAVTFVMQIETWYFLSEITVDPALLPRLFLMGLPPALLFIPLAAWLLPSPQRPTRVVFHRRVRSTPSQWILRILTVVVSYLVLYWLAGYFIAWQNPELRAFYGSPGPAAPFLIHTLDTLKNDPLLFPFQVVRALLWVLFAWPILRGSQWSTFSKALLVACLFSLPQNIGHLLANPLIPLASVRMSHLIETASSTFVFGWIVTYLLNPMRP